MSDKKTPKDFEEKKKQDEKRTSESATTATEQTPDQRRKLAFAYHYKAEQNLEKMLNKNYNVLLDKLAKVNDDKDQLSTEARNALKAIEERLERQTFDLLKGIDFDKPVSEKTIPAGKYLLQYRVSDPGYPGRFAVTLDTFTSPHKLGISEMTMGMMRAFIPESENLADLKAKLEKGFAELPKKIRKDIFIYQLKSDTVALESTANAIQDNWSISFQPKQTAEEAIAKVQPQRVNIPVQTPGSGKQLFFGDTRPFQKVSDLNEILGVRTMAQWKASTRSAVERRDKKQSLEQKAQSEVTTTSKPVDSKPTITPTNTSQTQQQSQTKPGTNNHRPISPDTTQLPRKPGHGGG